jgi:hypothetical protein
LLRIRLGESMAKTTDPVHDQERRAATLTPGGPHRAPVAVGMEAIDSDALAADVEATRELVNYGINPASTGATNKK